MLKLAFALLMSLSVSLAAQPRLRTETYFRPAQLIELLSDQASSLGLDNVVSAGSESDYLNEYAQALAEQTGNPISFIDSYGKSKYTQNILTFGFKLRGNTKLKTIMFEDSTEVVDGMSGFLDFRYKNGKINIKARDIRKQIQAGRCPFPESGQYNAKDCTWTRIPGTITAKSKIYSKTFPIRNLRDLLPVMTAYDEFVEAELKLMDSNGNIPIGWFPFTFDLDFERANIHIESTDSLAFPLKVDPNWPRLDILEAIDNHHRVLIENTTLEDALRLGKNLNTYGFGIALDSNNDITIVYAFGSQGNKGDRKTNYRARLSDYTYVSRSGVNYDLNPYDWSYKTNTLAHVQRRNNLLIMDAVNLNRLNNGLRPLKQALPRLYELAQREADRILAAGKITEPNLSSYNKTVVVASMWSGEATVREFVYDVNNNYLGSYACFDNFSNQRSKVYQLFESSGGYVCNRAVRDNWSRFDSFGSGIAFDAAAGEYVSVYVLTDAD